MNSKRSINAAKTASNRKQQILEVLASMLEDSPDNKITTAKLAANVGVSEAALYRHFPSKTKMLEGLIAFAEDTLFVRANLIAKEEINALRQCRALVGLYLGFCERNPGITRLLTVSALSGESNRLHARVEQLYERLETQLRIFLREAELREGQRTLIPISTAANLIMATAEGRVAQFARSGFKRPPTEGWEDQWSILSKEFMKPSHSV